MGFHRWIEKIKHPDPEEVKKIFEDNFWWHRWYKIGWKRYPISEHIRFYSESPDGKNFFGRSEFRSTSYYTDPTDLDKIQWQQY